MAATLNFDDPDPKKNKLAVIEMFMTMVETIENIPDKDFCWKVARLMHHTPISFPEFGGMIVDQQFLGTTLVMSSLPIPKTRLDLIQRIVEGKPSHWFQGEK